MRIYDILFVDGKRFPTPRVFTNLCYTSAFASSLVRRVTDGVGHFFFYCFTPAQVLDESANVVGLIFTVLQGRVQTQLDQISNISIYHTSE